MGKIVKVYTYVNYSGAVYKFHLIAKITGSCMEASIKNRILVRERTF